MQLTGQSTMAEQQVKRFYKPEKEIDGQYLHNEVRIATCMGHKLQKFRLDLPLVSILRFAIYNTTYSMTRCEF